jgi:hypothetical protein
VRLLARMREWSVQRRFTLTMVPVFDMYAARERARRGNLDEALPLLRDAVAKLFDPGQLLWSIPGTLLLVETLLERGADDDLLEADAAIDRLAAAPSDDDLVVRDVMLLRLHALLAKARGNETGYRDYRDRYRDMATSLGFDAHIAWAEAMP